MNMPLIVGNWKMNLLTDEAVVLAGGIRDFVKSLSGIRVVLAPSFTLLSEVRNVLSGSNVGLACQNFYFEEKGAYTGEVSAGMIKDAGCEFAIIGHSERRHLFGETDALINKKVSCAVEKDIDAILCVGETEDQRKTGKTFEIIEQQVCKGLDGLKRQDLQKISIAYEPVWAIGTGENATASQAEEVHHFIRKTITDKIYGNGISPLTILYGGSVTPENCSELLANKEVDGALVGGASLNIDSFCAIINAAKSV
ncbi:MAG: triose-phosphate isomerase [Nitrospinae bacterium]|nr:triose-phosphate isomerase [Nitrospinota bacterium]